MIDKRYLTISILNCLLILVGCDIKDDKNVNSYESEELKYRAFAEALSKKYGFISLKNLRLKNVREVGSERLVVFERELNDTNDILTFYVEGGQAFFNSLERNLLVDSVYHHVLWKGLDTAYYFVKRRNVPDSLEFIVGEYFYKNQRLMFNSNQRKYYLAHKDSLRKVRGNGLPELPEILEK